MVPRYSMEMILRFSTCRAFVVPCFLALFLISLNAWHSAKPWIIAVHFLALRHIESHYLWADNQVIDYAFPQLFFAKSREMFVMIMLETITMQPALKTGLLAVHIAQFVEYDYNSCSRFCHTDSSMLQSSYLHGLIFLLLH